jgi:hypothetical protein
MSEPLVKVPYFGNVGFVENWIIPLPLMEPKVSLPRSQGPATGPYADLISKVVPNNPSKSKVLCNIS